MKQTLKKSKAYGFLGLNERKERDEAKYGKKEGSIAYLFGLPVVSSSPKEVLEKIVQVIHEKAYAKPFFVVTAYSEFFLETKKNPRFAGALKQADMIVPDGVAVVAAIDYLVKAKTSTITSLGQGLAVGKKILAGEYKNRVIGVKLMETLLKLAAQNHYRVFLLGGWNGVAGRLAEKWKEKGVAVEWDEGWPQIQKALTHPTGCRPVIDKINRFKPDILLVSFGRFKQELWINQHREELRAGVIMGVGSAFDELANEGVWKVPVPEWVEKRGLKWLWRCWQDPKHIKRAWNAFPVFAWKVYKSTN